MQRTERILVVDDEAPIRRALQTALTGHGYHVEIAEDGQDGLVRAATYSPQLIVLDLVMPKLDGLAMLLDLRSWSQVPVLVLSARGDERDKVRALDLGADDYLTKPFGIDEFLARVRALLRRRTGEKADAITRFGDVTVDLGRRVVTKAGNEVHLTPTEFSLLAAFLAEPDRVLTHRHLLDRVWGGYAVDNAQQLRVYMGYLRKKLEDDPANPRWLITDPGVGYRLRLE